MSTATSETRWVRWVTTLVLGAVAATAIWLAGARDVAYLGFILVALAREPAASRSCRRRETGRP